MTKRSLNPEHHNEKAMVRKPTAEGNRFRPKNQPLKPQQIDSGCDYLAASATPPLLLLTAPLPALAALSHIALA